MLLFKGAFHPGLKSGAITLTFRRWEKPHVKAGGRYRCHPIGVLEVDAISRVSVDSITQDDAVKAGFPDRAALFEHLGFSTGEVWRVALHHGGDGDRVALALEDQLTDEDVKTIAVKLAKLDGKKRWTAKTLGLIGKHPRVAASKLAKRAGFAETLPFKEHVRKLKKLGLTQSFEVGYEISPRGRAFLARKKRW
jgi:hypothetical protein